MLARRPRRNSVTGYCTHPRYDKTMAATTHPKTGKVFLDNIDKFVKIQETYKDEPPAMDR